MDNRKLKIITHNGSFHPDDVFAVAVLSLYLEKLGIDFEVQRTRDTKLFEQSDYLVDVGLKDDPDQNFFDHHQEGGAGTRDDGVPFASFGLVWKKFGIEIAENQEVVNLIDKKLVSSIDVLDNGAGELLPILNKTFPYTIGHFIRSLNPNWQSTKNHDEMFKEAVLFAKRVLQSEIELARAEIESRKILDELYEKTEDKRFLILDKNYPWQFYVQKYPELLFVIEPAKENSNWEIEAVKNNNYNFENRLNFPSEWAGKRDEELQKITGVKGSIFCHNAMFFAVTKTLEEARELVKKAMGEKG